MAIIQISKLQARSGNLVDLPQLDEAEFAWASDDKRLFIGKTTPNENIEVLTGYSNISFSQITGSVGNLNINPVTLADGQALIYDGTNWVNRGGDVGGLINLGNVANIKITGQAGIGYVLQTDGLGNLSWTPKGALYTPIVNLTNNTSGNVITMKVANTTPYTNKQLVTISGGVIANASASGNINGKSFYVKLATDYASTGNVTLYTDLLLTTTANGAGLTSYTANSGVATASLGSGSGTATAGGTNTMVQFNNTTLLDGSSDFTWDFGAAKVLTVVGNANVTNLNATGVGTATRFISNIATGTTPLQVVSTTRVANLNVANAGYSDIAGTVTTNAQPNITSVGSLSSLTVTGNANVGNVGTAQVLATANVISPQLISNITTGTAPFVVTSTTQVANLNVATAGTVTTNAQPNITSVGTLTGLGVNGTITAVNITANTGVFTGNGNGLSSIVGANVTGTVTSATNASALLQNTSTATTVYPTFTTSSANGNSSAVINTSISANLSNASITATTFVGALSGAATTAGTVTTNAQPNITSVGTLSALTVTANVATGGIKTDNYYYANGVSISFAGSYSNSNVAAYLPTFTGTVGATALTTGANTTVGTITGNWGLSTGSKLTATYADLAEYYTADATYLPGTVLAFGGDQEVTLALNETNKVAGVVTTNPAFVMNETCKGPAVAIALQGRVPCKVTGTIHKGDMMVSAGNGYAKASESPAIGTVIGKSLENFDGIDGIIEVAIGKT